MVNFFIARKQNALCRVNRRKVFRTFSPATEQEILRKVRTNGRQRAPAVLKDEAAGTGCRCKIRGERGHALIRGVVRIEGEILGAQPEQVCIAAKNLVRVANASPLVGKLWMWGVRK
jgi:hypothetical protein